MADLVPLQQIEPDRRDKHATEQGGGRNLNHAARRRMYDGPSAKEASRMSLYFEELDYRPTPIGALMLPLAFDAYLAFTAMHPNTAPLSGSLGVSDRAAKPAAVSANTTMQAAADLGAPEIMAPSPFSATARPR